MRRHRSRAILMKNEYFIRHSLRAAVKRIVYYVLRPTKIIKRLPTHYTTYVRATSDVRTGFGEQHNNHAIARHTFDAKDEY